MSAHLETTGNRNRAAEPGRFVSAIQLDAWSICQESWRLGWVEGYDFRGTKNTAIGKLIHEAIEAAAKEQRGGTLNPSDIAERLADSPHREEAAAKVARFRPLDISGFIEAEREFQIRLNKRTRLVGRIDLARAGRFGAVIITDWKTGSPRPTSQGRIYATAARAMFPDADSITVRIEYLESGKTVSTEWTPELDRATRREVRLAAKKMRAGETTATTGEHCQRCHHLEYCKAASENREDRQQFAPAFDPLDVIVPSAPRPEPLQLAEAATDPGDESPPPSAFTFTTTTHRTEEAMRYQVGTYIPSKMPGPGETLHIITDGSFNPRSAIHWAMRESAGRIDRLFISTWGIDETTIDELLGHFDAGRIGQIHIAFSRYSANRDESLYGKLRRELSARGQTIRTWRNHSKIMSIEAAGFAITIAGSGNIIEARRMDCYEVTHSAELCAFHRGWMTYSADLHARSLAIAVPRVDVLETNENKRRAELETRAAQFAEWLPVGSLEPDQTAHVVHGGEFDFVSAVMWCIDSMDEPPALCLASWWLSREGIATILDLYDRGRLRSIAIVTCQTWRNRSEGLHRWLCSELDARGQEHRTWINHAKGASLLSKRDAYAICTSANLSKNENTEQFSIARSRVAAEMHAGWMTRADGLMNRMKSTGERQGYEQSIPPKDPAAETVSLFIGRFQPLHVEHAQTLRAMTNPAIVIVEGVKSSQDRRRNPLDYEQRRAFVLAVRPDAKVYRSQSGYLPDVLAMLRREKLETTAIHSGQDRMNAYREALRRTNRGLTSAPCHHSVMQSFNFDVRWVDTCTKREVSATQLRAAIRAGDLETAREMLPPELWPEMPALAEAMR